MKKMILILLMASIFVVACKKNSEEKLNRLSGTWELIESNSPKTMYAQGAGNKTIFTTSSYKDYRQNKLVDSGSYAITNSSTDSLGQWNGNISMNTLPCYFYVRKDTLEIDAPGIIFTNAVYIKIDD
ncbi:hypothetical protein [Arachidicoccus ginsenosidimutans]|uniref:hypothetical protein n=1 Tax=Arachidicoccus sp. BS20 TaxID=1850526 RepID=UPI0012E7531A|nr:hypothetical protein [Arachidicoccus sp. BS20]